jgi:hypothetical protein
MKYALLIYEDEAVWGDDKNGPLLEETIGKHMALVEELGPKQVGGAGLKPTPTATTLKVDGDRQTIHDGPFAETKEQLGGFYLVDVADLDEAIAIAKRIPIVGRGSVEIRPLIGPDGGA